MTQALNYLTVIAGVWTDSRDYYIHFKEERSRRDL